ncbi:MAG TPA: SdpI family protein [Vicinamibacterales bacterium]|jgi:uncharacterized membrane protein|nr:SdpI family protein [Vicinamibacterales bacterium]
MRLWRTSHVVLCGIGAAMGAAALYTGFPAHAVVPASSPARWIDDASTAFLLPIAALATDVLLRGLVARHPVEAEDSTGVASIYDAIMLRVVAFLMGVHAMVLAGSLGLLVGRAWASRVVPLMLGLAMMGVGNLLPRTRRNLAIGIRTARTLSDRAVWIRTHRLVGRLVVITGLLVVLAAIAVPAPFGTGFILGIGPVTFIGGVIAVRFSARRARTTTTT